MEAPDARFLEAVSDFNRGRYFEAHEIWEELWKESGPLDEVRLFHQGLIQVAAGYHKLQKRHLRGARTLLSRGVEKLDRYPSPHQGVELRNLRCAVREDLRRLAGVEEASFSTQVFLWPKIGSSLSPRGAPGPG